MRVERQKNNALSVISTLRRELRDVENEKYGVATEESESEEEDDSEEEEDEEDDDEEDGEYWYIVAAEKDSSVKNKNRKKPTIFADARHTSLREDYERESERD